MNDFGKFFVLAILIIYVMVATAVIKPIKAYISGMDIAPWLQQFLSLGVIIVLGLGLILLNQWVKNWLENKKDK